MKSSLYQWQIAEKSEASEELLPALAELNIPTELAPLLWRRGVKNIEDLKIFMNPSIEALHDPFLMYDMEKAVDRIQEAIGAGQKILIYGDYDADGITSTTVMKEAIELVGGEVEFYLPNRFNDGYGPNKAAFERLIDNGVELIVTVDNGVAGHEAIAYANERGVDVIVTDHHELPENLPEAYAIVHPRHPLGNYPFGDLAGVGVAFKVATALLDEIPYEFLDLVAIGTIADLVSLTGENRALVKHGLLVFKESDRIGLQALCEVAKISKETITEENIGFGIGPRLNAIGRLGDASPGVLLMTTFDEGEAQEIAEWIQSQNTARQEIVNRISEEALEMVAESSNHQVNVLAKAGWHQGVLGIVASKVVQATGKPTIILEINEEEQIAKGSGRSVSQLNLYEAMSQHRDVFTNFGGHHMAAGLTLPVGNLETLQNYLDEYVQEHALDFSQGRELIIDQKISVSQATVAFIQSLQLLAPFGTDNPAPYFLLEEAAIQQLKQIGATQQHLKFQMSQSKEILDCIAFSMGSEMRELQGENQVQVVGQLGINEWNGLKKAQLMVKDFSVNGLQIFDYRGNKYKELSLDSKQTLYVVFDEKNKTIVPNNHEKQFLIANDQQVLMEWSTKNIEQIVIVDCPSELSDLAKIIQKIDYNRIYLMAFSRDECYLNGIPTRDQFGKLFTFIKQQGNVDVRYKTKEIAQYLKVKESVLIFMIEVFLDLGFVTIDNGVMNRVDTPISRPLTESLSYQRREKMIKTEEFLLYSDLNELRNWIAQQEENK